MKLPPLAAITNALAPWPVQPAQGFLQHAAIPGWSQPAHYEFFRAALAALPAGARVLVCGVYHGKDLALLATAADELGLPIELTGIDLFADAPCADWTPEQRRAGSWHAAGYGTPPSYEAARRNCPRAVLVQGNATAYMRSPGAGEYDLIYLDTSHDYATVRAEIEAASRILRPDGLLAGDDYAPEGPGWGVHLAVQALLPAHAVFFNRIWLAPA